MSVPFPLPPGVSHQGTGDVYHRPTQQSQPGLRHADAPQGPDPDPDGAGVQRGRPEQGAECQATGTSCGKRS